MKPPAERPLPDGQGAAPTAKQCDGRCCAVFPIHGWAERKVTAGTDSEYIAAMVVQLSPVEAADRAAAFGISFPADWQMEETAEAGDVYKCRLWDEQTLRCTAYAQRPRMCYDYPYSMECIHCGWTLPVDQLLRRYDETGKHEWTRWMWDGRYGRYRLRPGRSYNAPPYEENGWRWDGRHLYPHSKDDQRWNPRRRLWTAA